MLKYEVTRDPALLDQYYRIREICFREDLGLPEFDGSEDERDRSSHILIARFREFAVGGIRITGRSPDRPISLPIEEQGVDLAEGLPQLQLRNVAYCQWSRLAIQAEFRTTATLREFCKAIIDHSRKLGYVYHFSVASMNRARLYKRLYSLVDHRCELLPNIRIAPEPGFDGLPHVLSVGFLDPAFEELFWAHPEPASSFGFQLAMPGATA